MRSTGIPVVDTTNSAHARLKPASLGAVRLQDHFWAPRRETNRQHTLKTQYEHLESTNRLANFRRAAGLEEGPFEGIYFNDSDVYKWLEGAASTLAEHDDAEIQAMVGTVVRDIQNAQQRDGYLHTYFTLHPEKGRWENLKDLHQLYCMGHFIQAAVAHYRATGSEALLQVASRLVDCIEAEFGWGKREETDGHEEIELALVELYRATGDKRCFELAQFFVDVRGRGLIGGREYHQDHTPARELKRVTGHSVRALYYAAGVTDIFLETGESALLEALEAQWANFTERQMYISGGAGSRWEGEAFGFDYELPNQRAYTETCAAIAAVMWAWRMGQHRGEARFFDVLERALYNGIISGLSLSGDEYFYQNPLANDGTHRRQKWFGCACCPPNLARFLAQLPGYFYSTSEEGLWVHLFAQSEAKLVLPNGGEVVLEQRTEFPWQGEVTLKIQAAPAGEFSVFIRIPDWAGGATLDGQSVEAGAYVELRRDWKEGDMVRLSLPMTPQYLTAHPYALENADRVAVQRGPLLFCAEAADNGEADLRDLRLPAPGELSSSFEAELLNGIVVLTGQGTSAPAWGRKLYTPQAEVEPVPDRLVEVTLIPYYAWAHRASGQMQVWLKAPSGYSGSHLD